MDTGRKAQYHAYINIYTTYIYTNTIYIPILPKSTFTFDAKRCVCVCVYVCVYFEDLILRFHDS